MSTSYCPTWCTRTGDHAAESIRPDGEIITTHSRTVGEAAGSAALVTIDAIGGATPAASIWGGEDLTAAECRELAALLTAAADELDKI